jgi:hypothetical protein
MKLEPASETGGLLSVVPTGPEVIIFGPCGRKNHSFGSPDGCDELGDQVREYQSKQNAQRVPMPSSRSSMTSDPSGAVLRAWVLRPRLAARYARGFCRVSLNFT